MPIPEGTGKFEVRSIIPSILQALKNIDERRHSSVMYFQILLNLRRLTY